ncbi:MAG: DUF3618 domain-containing protein [Pseudonocardiales bacterium]|jgi:hypothetical protein|nr:DUF3618 domain-containing protein [Pseudonocardiales bacterium]
MTSTNDPDQIRAEIERTQAELSRDVDAFTDKVSPGRIVERRVDRVRGAAGRWKDAVMGSSHDDRPAHAGVRDGAHHLAGAVSGAASGAATSVSDAAHDAPQAVRRRTEGNPLAAGLIAFGAGMLVSALLPAARREQELAERAKEHAGELGRPVAEAAKQAVSELREPAREAAESVRSTAEDAGRTVADEGRSTAQDVRSQAGDSVQAVRQGPGA